MAIPLQTIEAARAHFKEGYDRVAQQTASRLRAYAMVDTGCTGKSTAHRYIESSEMKDVTGRFQPTVGDEVTWRQRYIFPRKAEKVNWVAEDDQQDLDLKMAPTGSISTEHYSAAGRKTDDILIAGILGPNLEGLEDNMTTQPLPASQYVAVNYRRDGGTANTGLTLVKLAYGKAKFSKAEVYGQEQKQAGAKLCMAVSQDELDNLMLDVEQTQTSLINSLRPLVDGEIDYFYGVKFIRTERLPFTTSGDKIIRTCPMWVSNLVALDIWQDFVTKIDVRADRSHAIQIRSMLKSGAARVNDQGVVALYTEQAA